MPSISVYAPTGKTLKAIPISGYVSDGPKSGYKKAGEDPVWNWGPNQPPIPTGAAAVAMTEQAGSGTLREYTATVGYATFYREADATRYPDALLPFESRTRPAHVAIYDDDDSGKVCGLGRFVDDSTDVDCVGWLDTENEPDADTLRQSYSGVEIIGHAKGWQVFSNYHLMPELGGP